MHKYFLNKSKKNIFKLVLKLLDKEIIIVIFVKKKNKGQKILSKSFKRRLNVALAYNVKPESDTFTENLPPIRSNNFTKEESVIETYAEWDTWETINALKEAIEVYHDINLIEADINAFEKFRQSKPDIVFNISEGFNNLSRESQIPAMLDMLNIPYTGSDALTLGICLDKARTKEILSYYKIPNANFILVDKYKPLSLIHI